MNKVTFFNKATLIAVILTTVFSLLLNFLLHFLLSPDAWHHELILTIVPGICLGMIIGYLYNYALSKASVLSEVEKFAGIGTWSKNFEAKTLSASDEVYRMFGYQPNEIELPENFFLNTVHPADLEMLTKAEEGTKNGQPYELESRHFRKDGTQISVINKCLPKLLDDGTVDTVSGTILDITKLKHHEKKSAENQQLVNGILRATPDPLFLLDLNTSELLYCNAAMDRVIKHNPVFQEKYAARGVRLFRELVHPDDLEAYDAMNEVLRTGENFYKINFRTLVIDNTYRWVEQRVLVYDRAPGGFVNQVLVVSKDINERVLAEQEAKDLNEKLVSQNLAMKKINAELDQFVYSVSHDLRAPLSTILGLVNLCELGATHEELQDYMLKIGDSVKKLDGFIQDILDYSRNTRTELESRPIVLEELVHELIDNLRLVEKEEVQIEIEAQEEVAYIGDKRRISIILNNILSNSFKYIDPGKDLSFIKIKISTSKKGCRITIEDNGIGIGENSKDKIFTMFYRGTERSDGSGIGLYIVQEIVAKLGGSVDIKSAEGEGTTVHLKLPHLTSKEIADG